MTTNLVFRDTHGHEKAFAFDSFSWLTFAKAFDSLFGKHMSEDNTTFVIERPDDDESLTIETAVGIIGRRRGKEPPEYTRFYETGGGGANIWTRFANVGYSGLDELPEWLNTNWVADRESLLPEGSYANVELERIQAKRAGDERRRQIRAMPKLDQTALRDFCRVWADSGHNEYDGSTLTHHVLFDGGAGEDEAAVRDELLRTVVALGLELVPTPSNGPEGSVWVRADPRIDLELEKW